MKRKYLLVFGLFVLISALVLIGPHIQPKAPVPDADLRAALDFGAEAADKVQRLYAEKQADLEADADELFALRTAQQAPQELCIERAAQGYAWYDYETYERTPLEPDENLQALLDCLFDEYDVSGVTVTADRISFSIAEDALIYLPSSAQAGDNPPVHSKPLDEHWFHFWFEYGV